MLRNPDLYHEAYDDEKDLVTIIEIEGTHYNVTYNRYGNQFEVTEIVVFEEDYPNDPPEYELCSDIIYRVCEDILQERFECNFDYGNEKI